MPFSFWGYRMAQAHNAVEGLKSSIEREDEEWADINADSCQKNLQKAREETLEAIEQRDSGKSREDDPDVKRGILW